ncbi:MAG: hypothetical protein ACI4BA_06640 [Prevotella sp.]
MLLEKNKQNCFSVPDGYFDRLVPDVMQRIPQQTTRKKRFALSVRVAVAASLVGVVMGLSSYVYFHNKQIIQSGHALVSMDAESNVQNSYQDVLMDYAMMDNTDIYACITSTDY